MHARFRFATGLRQAALATGLAALGLADLRADAAATADDSDLAGSAVEREELVISASRSSQDPKYTASSVTLVSLAALDDSQILDLQTALAREPGAAIVSTGATGSQSSIFLRGASSHQTLLFVDGVRMNDRSAAYANFLGGADLDSLGRLEVLRGPQGTLYGSSAMGGVIAMDTLAVGDGPATGRVTARGGSFGTWGGALETRGGLGGLGYSAAVSYLDTNNDRPGNKYDVWNYAARLQFAPGDSPLLLGATVRRQDATYQEPGAASAYPFPGVVDSENTLATAFAEVRPSDGFASRLTAALHERDYRWESGSFVSTNDNRREIVDWINTWSASERLELVGGANYERSRYRIGGAPTRDDMLAGYISGNYRALDTLTITAGARLDDFDGFGSATTGRAGVAWNVREGTKLRATYGTGFAAPGSDDLSGVQSWGQLANDNLKAEKVKGWDIGIDQAFHGGDIVASVTWFRHQYRNLFEWETVNFETFEGMVVNRARATTEGVETALSARITGAVKARIGYTYLEAMNDTDGLRLIRRPRHTADAEVTARIAAPWLIGAGVHAVADRVESAWGASGEIRVPSEDYITVRVFTSYRATEDILLKLRVENLFDAEYAEVRGYPALPVGIFGGIEWSF